MKNYYYLFLTIVVLTMSVSCSVSRYKQDFSTEPVYPIWGTYVSNGTLETDLEMIGEVSASIAFVNQYSSKVIAGSYIVDELFLSGAPRRYVSQINMLKSELLYKAIKESGCDILLAPIYTVHAEGYYDNSQILKGPLDTCYMTVKGYGAKIKGIRQIKSE